MSLNRRLLLTLLGGLTGAAMVRRGWASDSGTFMPPAGMQNQQQPQSPTQEGWPTSTAPNSEADPQASEQLQDIDQLAWFKPTDGILADWRLLFDPEDPLQFTLIQRRPSTETPWQIFLLFPRKSSAYDTAVSTILTVFQQKRIPARFQAINFEQDRMAGEAALAVARQQQVDAIFSVGSEATALAHDTFHDQSIPVISVCSKDPVLLGQAPDYTTGSGTNFAFTSLNVPIDVQMAYLKQLRDQLKMVAVMYDRQNQSAIQTQVEPLQEIARSANIEVIEVAVNQDTAQVDLEQAMPDAIATMKASDPNLESSIFWITGSTAVFREIQTINALSGNVPVFSAVPDVVTAGDDSAMLSVGVSFESNAYLAAIYGIDILRQQVQTGALPVGLISPPDIAINFGRARSVHLKIPFQFFESASFIYDYEGQVVRENGVAVRR